MRSVDFFSSIQVLSFFSQAGLGDHTNLISDHPSLFTGRENFANEADTAADDISGTSSLRNDKFFSSSVRSMDASSSSTSIGFESSSISFSSSGVGLGSGISSSFSSS